MEFETEHPFSLPRGFLAADGAVHRDGVMRLARAGDEIQPLEDPRVRGNRAYFVILLLARVIVRLGALEGDAVTPAVIEALFAADLAYLRDVYRQINGIGESPAGVSGACPHCGKDVTAVAIESPLAD